MLANYLILLASVALPVAFLLSFTCGLLWWAVRKLLRAPGEGLR